MLGNYFLRARITQVGINENGMITHLLTTHRKNGKGLHFYQAQRLARTLDEKCLKSITIHDRHIYES